MTYREWLSILSSSQNQQSGNAPLEDLIYKFLLQSNFPRASILLDADLLDSVGSNDKSAGTAPSFVIVDPDTVKPLAIINTVSAVDDEMLKSVAIQTRSYAAKLAGKSIQGFVIRVDIQAASESEQVQFYRIWPNSSFQQLTPKRFPDLDTFKVSRKLADAKNIEARAKNQDLIQPVQPTRLKTRRNSKAPRPGMALYYPAILLLVLVLFESVIKALRGSSFLSVTQTVLIISAALLFTVPPAIRYFRDS